MMMIHVNVEGKPWCGTRSSQVVEPKLFVQLPDTLRCKRCVAKVDDAFAALPGLHATEIENYLTCKERWSYQAPKPRGRWLEPTDKSFDLQFGLEVHDALRNYYANGEDPRAYFLENSKLEAIGNDDSTLLGVAMLRGYVDWAAKVDQYLTVQAPESEWNVTTPLGVKLTGRFDGVATDNHGNVYILEFKTTGRTNVSWTGDSIQGSIYNFAGQLLWPGHFGGVRYRFLLKKVPLDPLSLFLKSGVLTNRKTLPSETTEANFRKALTIKVLASMLEVSPEKAYDALQDPNVREQEWYPTLAKGYRGMCAINQDVLATFNDDTFFKEIVEARTPEECATLDSMLAAIKMEMLGPVYPSGLGSAWAVCKTCSFKDPCYARRLGDSKAADLLIEEMYKERE